MYVRGSEGRDQLDSVIEGVTELGLTHIEHAPVSVMKARFPDEVPDLRIIGVTRGGFIHGREEPAGESPIRLVHTGGIEGRPERVSGDEETVAGRQVSVPGASPQSECASSRIGTATPPPGDLTRSSKRQRKPRI